MRNRSKAAEAVKQFCNSQGDIFQKQLIYILQTLFFQEIRRDTFSFGWMLHSTLFIVKQQGPFEQLVINLLNEQEKDNKRKEIIFEKFKAIIDGCSLNSLDEDEKEIFFAKFADLSKVIREV